MKILIPVTVAALTVSTASSTSNTPSWINELTRVTNKDSYHMKPVHVVHARAQSDAPVWIESLSAFGSKYGGSTDEAKFRGALDTVNTASVEGALMYVQAEGINYNTRSKEDRCWRKNGMKYVVFYDIVFAQTNETMVKYESEYGRMLPMDGGQCTPESGTDGFSEECISLNGNATVSEVGPFIGGMLKDTDPRAPYPNCWWYSFPNTCPLMKWTKEPKKTDECRANTRQGLCDFNTLPDGIQCTYNYRILGYVPIDDVVGITSMKYTNNTAYPGFAEFCEDNGVEFMTDDNGAVVQSITFWENPTKKEANAVRSQKLLATYAAQLTSKLSTQIDEATFRKMLPLPDVAVLASENPPCYQNIEECATAKNGCKRELFGQICKVCDNTGGNECVTAPSDFTFPTLKKATVTSSATNVVVTVGALVTLFGLSLLMG